MARKLITGVDAAGRSCVLEELTIGDGPLAEGTRVTTVYETTSTPDTRPSGQGNDTDMGVPPGTTRWIYVELGPGFYATHHTDTVDFDTIVSGYIDIILDDGPHRLNPGDCVVVTGIDHAWQPGPEGCVFSVTLLGTPSPVS